MPVLERNAKLYLQPQPLAHSTEYTHVAIGDLHGNSLKFIYTLIEEGVLTLQKPADYFDLNNIYTKSSKDLTKQDIRKFKSILKKAAISQAHTITLIGDELSDRGRNDYFTLLIMQKLHDAKVDLNITMSNHSFEFIHDFEKPKFTGQTNLGTGQSASLSGMTMLIQRGIIKEQEVRRIVKKAYIPKVQAISYGLNVDGSLVLYSHAPIGLETVRALAEKYNIHYDDSSVATLIDSIDAINQTMNTLFQQRKLSNELEMPLRRLVRSNRLPVTLPIIRLIWNREIGTELETQPRGEFEIEFVHGHIGEKSLVDPSGKPIESHVNLDNNLGKKFANHYMEAKHITKVSNEFSPKQYHRIADKENRNKRQADLRKPLHKIKSRFKQLKTHYQTDKTSKKQPESKPSTVKKEW